VRVYIRVYRYIYTYILKCTHKNIHTTYIHTYIHTYIRTSARTLSYTYVYAHTHMNNLRLAISKQEAHVKSILQISYTYVFIIKLRSVHLCADFKFKTVGDYYCFIVSIVLCCLVVQKGVFVRYCFGFWLPTCAPIYFTKNNYIIM
jgi:hypothetical protein